MSDRERFVRTLTGKAIDRVPFMKIFGGTNAALPRWEEERPGIQDEIDDLLGFEGTYRGWAITPVNFGLSQVGEPITLEETDERVVQKWPDGTVKLRRNDGDYHGQTIEWPVKSRADWERIKARHLQADDPDRVPGNWRELVEEYRTRTYPLQLTHGASTASRGT